MIFVTVGTTNGFDELIREIDRLIAEGTIVEEVFAQIGAGRYIPTRMKWVLFLDDLAAYYDRADFVICHGGVGSVFELLHRQKEFIAVANHQMADDHQADLLRALCRYGWCNACFDVKDLGEMIQKRTKPMPYPENPLLPEAIWSYIQSSERDVSRKRFGWRL